MLSILICSVRPEMAERLAAEVERTVGLPHEVIVFDNRERCWPIAKAYNAMARQARYPYLLFVHEDVRILSSGWGELMVQQLAVPECGVIGVAGTVVKSAGYSGWLQYPAWTVSHHYQRFATETRLMTVNCTPNVTPFKEVIALDGMALFVRKTLWEAYPFDEAMLPGFHGYDLDFCLQAAWHGYKNYVCCDDRFLIEHFSLGHFSDEWFDTTLRLHDEKWKGRLPMATEEARQRLPEQEREAEERVAYSFLFHILRSGHPAKKRILRAFWHRPLTGKHLLHCLSCTFKYIRG